MISLQDEISKFQKLVYNKQLAEFVTVDKMFVGGGITMESLIQENNFVVQELKKMNTVFKNFCKLNEKVYKKIMEHQLSMHGQQARLNALVSNIDRKLDDSIKTIKLIQEDTLFHNQKSQTMVTQTVQPIMKELENKVDVTTFTAQMKKFLQEYDEEAEQDLNNGEGIDKGGHGGGGSYELQPGSPYPRKKGKVSYDEFYKFREELDNKMKTTEQDISMTAKDSIETKELIMKYIPQINKIAFEINQQKNDLFKIKSDEIQSKNALKSSIEKIGIELDNRLNEQVWKNKFEGFFDKQINPIIKNIEQVIKTTKKEAMAYKQQSMNKFMELDNENIKNKTSTSLINRNIQKMNDSVRSIQQKTKQNQAKIFTEVDRLDKKIEGINQYYSKEIAKLEKNVTINIKQINQKIEDLALTIQDAVIKIVNKRFEQQLKLIEKDIRQNRQSIKHIIIELGILTQQVKNIKDVLSQKANFSDIIMHVERKADREDFKQFQEKMQQSSQNFISKNMNESLNISRLQRHQNSTSRKMPSISKVNKTTMVQQSASQRTEIDSGTKLFMCGLEGSGDSRKIQTQNSRRKSFKSTTAIVSDFLL